MSAFLQPQPHRLSLQPLHVQLGLLCDSRMGPKARTPQDIALPGRCSHLAGPFPRWAQGSQGAGPLEGGHCPLPSPPRTPLAYLPVPEAEPKRLR